VRKLFPVTLLALLAASVLLVSCASDDNEGQGSTASSTDSFAPDDAFAFTEMGPYPVGITTLRLDSGPEVEVWYPAVQGTTGTDTYDLRSFTPDAIQAILTGDALSTFTIDAGRNAEPASGPFPLVLFSHGSAGIRLQSSFLTAHLASWGMIVAAPDHPSRDLRSRLGGGPDQPTESVDDLLGTLALMAAQNEQGAFEGIIDMDNVGTIGHSAGGGTALLAASDPLVDGYVSMASGIVGDTPNLPDKPSLFLAGATDQIVPSDRTRAAFEAVPAPSLLWIIGGVGHNGFDDFCTFGNGLGIIGVAIASGLEPLLESQPALKALGEDGCVAPAVPVTQTYPIVHHAVTAWLRSLFGVDDQPVGLGTSVADDYAVPVEIVSKD
jgi:dienelactone hydrolase